MHSPSAQLTDAARACKKIDRHAIGHCVSYPMKTVITATVVELNVWGYTAKADPPHTLNSDASRVTTPQRLNKK